VTLLPALGHDCEYVVISAEGNSASGVNRSALLDILIDPAGGINWSELISDLLCGYAGEKSSLVVPGVPYQYHFPLWIPAGASIGAQMRNAAVSVQTDVIIQAYGGNKNPASWRCGQRVSTVGTMSPSTSRGQSHTSGNIGTFSSWVDLGSALPYPGIAAQFAMQCEGSAAVNNLAYYFEFGSASTRIGPRRYHVTGNSESAASLHTGPIFYEFPSGLQMQVRGTCSGAAEAVDVAAYVVS
jgi:hypothetical protein